MDSLHGNCRKDALNDEVPSSTRLSLVPLRCRFPDFFNIDSIWIIITQQVLRISGAIVDPFIQFAAVFSFIEDLFDPVFNFVYHSIK
jgi:hypothetical protein